MPFGKRSSSLRGVLHRAIPAVLCAAGLAAAAFAAPTAPARASTADASTRGAITAPAGVVTGVATIPNVQSVLSWWTAARRLAAKPVGIIVAGKAPKRLPPTARQPGKPGRVPGSAPAGSSQAVFRTAAIAPVASYDSFTPPERLWPTYPYRVNGRLFFMNNGLGYSCSATAVASASGSSNENEIWTAGHCLVNTESNDHVVDSYAVFIPAYDGNVSDFDPYGEFVWNGGWATTGAWYRNRDFSEDEAAMTVSTSSTTGQTLGSAVGWDGFAWNQPVNELFVAFGYPVAPPYNGLNLVEDIAYTAGLDSYSGANPVNPIYIGNPMTGGSSGGAWNIDWSDSSPGYINGHNDYKYYNLPLLMYSPYQDSLSDAVRCFAHAGC